MSLTCFATLALVLSCLGAQTVDLEQARQALTSGRAKDAAAIYRKLLLNDPENPDLLLNLAIAEYQSRRFREALESATAALKLAPGLMSARMFQGASYLELGDFSKAVESLEFVVTANPRDRNARLMLAEALLGAGRPDAAIAHFRASFEMLPDNPRVWYGLARSHEALGEKESAAQAWDQLMKLPPSLQSHWHSAEVNSAVGRWREAAVEWRAALKLTPKDYKARLGLAWSLFRSRDYTATLETLNVSLGERDTPEAKFLYGASLLNLGQPTEAMSYLRDAIAIDPKLLPARAAMGQALLQTGDPAGAVPFLESSASVDEDGSLHFQLFRAYQLLDRKAEAQKALAAYQERRKAPKSSH